MANDCIPFFEPGQHPTATAEAAVTGKRFVQISGDRFGGPAVGVGPEPHLYTVGPPNTTGALGAGKRVFGVAGYDVPQGGDVKVIRGGIVPVKSGAAIAAGVEVETDANGQAITLASGVAVGLCLANCTSGADAEILLYL